MTAWPQIGDAIEVRAMERITYTCIQETWLPVTVCYVDHGQIGVAFSDGQRMVLQRNSGRGLYRKPNPAAGERRWRVS